MKGWGRITSAGRVLTLGGLPDVQADLRSRNFMRRGIALGPCLTIFRACKLE